MKIQVLEYFVTLSESKSINEAAQKLYIAQPSLSKSLQLMEKELGCALFVRTDAGIQLTEAGKKMLPEARQVLNYYQGWKDLGHRAALRQIDIYAACSFPDFIFPQIILRLRKHYPDLLLNYSVCMHPEKHISRSTEEPVLALFVCSDEKMAEQTVQLQGNPPDLLLEGAYYCLVNARSPLAGLKCVNAELLKDTYLVLPETKESFGSFSDIASDIISATSRRRIIYVSSATNVIDLVRQDPEVYAYSYYPALKRYAGVESGELVPVPFEGRALNKPLVLSYSKPAYEQHPAVRDLIGCVREEIQKFHQRYNV